MLHPIARYRVKRPQAKGLHETTQNERSPKASLLESILAEMRKYGRRLGAASVRGIEVLNLRHGRRFFEIGFGHGRTIARGQSLSPARGRRLADSFPLLGGTREDVVGLEMMRELSCRLMSPIVAKT